MQEEQKYNPNQKAIFQGSGIQIGENNSLPKKKQNSQQYWTNVASVRQAQELNFNDHQLQVLEEPLMQNQPQADAANDNSQQEARQNIQQSVRQSLTKSVKIIFLQAIFSLGKIIASSLILSMFRQECSEKGQVDHSERLFLFLMLSHDGIFLIVNLIYLVLSFQTLRTDNIDVSHLMNASLQQQQENQQDYNGQDNSEENNYNEEIQMPQEQQQNYIDSKCGCLNWMKDFVYIYFLILWIWGQTTVYFAEVTCQDDAPGIYYLIIVYIIFGYISICYPLFILICFCLCFPVIFLIAMYLGRGATQTPIDKKILKSLKPVKFEKKPQNIEDECLICMVPYEDKDEVIYLPCHEKHYFHADCIKKWLQINGVCPICRTKPTQPKKKK